MKGNEYYQRLDGVRTATSRRRFLQTSAIGGTGLLAGCLGAARESSTTLTMGYQPFSAHAWEALVMKHDENIVGKYLPERYSLNWQSALQGAVIGNRMSVGKNQVGWVGDMPALTTIAQTETPASLVGLSNWSRGQQCNLLIVPRDSDIEQTSDIDGETVGVTTGSCTHRYLLRILEEEDIDVTIADTGISTILANLREGRIAAGLGWEPSIASSVFQEGVARYVSTGAEYDIIDAGGLVMSDSLIENHREAATAILKAELEATQVMATDRERTLDLVAQEQDLRYFDRPTLNWGVYEDPPIGETLNRLVLSTDYERFPEPRELMRRTGPEFLVEQGALDAVPSDDRYKPEVVHKAANELAETVSWEPRQSPSSQSGNATQSGNASQSRGGS